MTFRGATLRWPLFADILKVGVPGLINVMITNLSVVLLTGIAGQLGKETAIGYALGARLEYILIPLAFGFGTSIVAMVGTNWGARQYRRAREIAWTGAGTVAATCAVIGIFFALFPSSGWAFSATRKTSSASARRTCGSSGPIYSLYGLGMGLYFATQGFGNALWTVTANAVRLLVSSACALIAVYWLGLGALGFFVSIARRVLRLRRPDSGRRPPCAGAAS